MEPSKTETTSPEIKREETLIQLLIKRAKETEAKYGAPDVSPDERVRQARKFIFDSFTTLPSTYKEGRKKGIYASEADFIEQRIKLAHAIKTVVDSSYIHTDKLKESGRPAGIGISYIPRDLPRPNDMSEKEWAYFNKAAASASWTADGKNPDPKDSFASGGLLGAVVLRENMLDKDVYDFARIMFHELGHTKQFAEGRETVAQDEQISDNTKEYLKTIQRKPWFKAFDVIAHEARFNEIDADNFSFEVIKDLLQEAEKENGATKKSKSAKRSMGLQEKMISARHKICTAFYPLVEARGKKFNERQAAEKQPVAETPAQAEASEQNLDNTEEQPVVEKISKQEILKEGYENTPYIPTNEQIEKEKKENERSRELLEKQIEQATQERVLDHHDTDY